MANVKLGTKAVGSTVKLKVNGAAKEFIVIHQGKPSSDYDNAVLFRSHPERILARGRAADQRRVLCREDG